MSKGARCFVRSTKKYQMEVLMVKIIDGNLLDATEEIIAHQVNCKGVMGSGVAKAIRNKYPRVYSEYKSLCQSKGSAMLGNTYMHVCNDGKRVIDIFGQDSYGWDKQYTDVDALKDGLNQIFHYAHAKKISAALPYGIGCGRGGADWNVVSPMIEALAEHHDVNVTLYKI